MDAGKGAGMTNVGRQQIFAKRDGGLRFIAQGSQDFPFRMISSAGKESMVFC